MKQIGNASYHYMRFIAFWKGDKLDVLVNNAAFIKFSDIRDISFEEFDKILSVNLRAPFILAKLAIPLF
jgi:NAD(P)-dependent dehydrogenase (short-subunit alcohol dehydrogenase family)